MTAFSETHVFSRRHISAILYFYTRDSTWHYEEQNHHKNIKLWDYVDWGDRSVKTWTQDEDRQNRAYRVIHNWTTPCFKWCRREPWDCEFIFVKRLIWDLPVMRTDWIHTHSCAHTHTLPSPRTFSVCVQHTYHNTGHVASSGLDFWFIGTYVMPNAGQDSGGQQWMCVW